MGKEEMTKTKLASIIAGEVFGETSLMRDSETFDGSSDITVEAESISCKLFFAKASEFARNFPKVIEDVIGKYR